MWPRRQEGQVRHCPASRRREAHLQRKAVAGARRRPRWPGRQRAAAVLGQPPPQLRDRLRRRHRELRPLGGGDAQPQRHCPRILAVTGTAGNARPPTKLLVKLAEEGHNTRVHLAPGEAAVDAQGEAAAAAVERVVDVAHDLPRRLRLLARSRRCAQLPALRLDVAQHCGAQVVREIVEDQAVQVVEVAHFIDEVLQGCQLPAASALQHLYHGQLQAPEVPEVRLPVQRVDEPRLRHDVHAGRAAPQQREHALRGRGRQEPGQVHVPGVQEVQEVLGSRLTTILQGGQQGFLHPQSAASQHVPELPEQDTEKARPALPRAQQLADPGGCQTCSHRFSIGLCQLLQVLA
mmetsp:Transcript_45934/g.146675  ORF Transcript_45934/g.146675 Transcript_45934/m.146675 type:complete len:348 (+) Transcript_45934:997-2040(+)